MRGGSRLVGVNGAMSTRGSSCTFFLVQQDATVFIVLYLLPVLDPKSYDGNCIYIRARKVGGEA